MAFKLLIYIENNRGHDVKTFTFVTFNDTRETINNNGIAC